MAKNNPLIQTTNLDAMFNALRTDPLRYMNDTRGGKNDDIPNRNYAAGATVSSLGSSMTKMAAGSGMIYGQPQFFSPVHTPINWQIPSKRLETFQWSRFFYQNEPKVAAAIDFYSFFPMNDYEHVCRNRHVKKYFDNFKKRLDLSKWCRLISHEIHLLGDCFPFVEISCDDCRGSGKISGEVCEHRGGTVKRIVILNFLKLDILLG